MSNPPATTEAALRARVVQLEEAIRNHRGQRGDDRCWIDDRELYATIEPALSNTALPALEEFMGNCRRFHASRQAPGDTYVTVEARLKPAHDALDAIEPWLLAIVKRGHGDNKCDLRCSCDVSMACDILYKISAARAAR